MKILFKGSAFAKFRAYVHGIDYEISGFGKITKQDDLLIVEDVKIFKQTVTGGNTVMDRQALAKFWDELIVAGEDIGKWKLWWHSHVHMAASFSGTDYATIDEFDTELPEDNWMLSIVTNKEGVITPQIDVFQPIRCTIKNVPYDVDMSEKIEPINVLPEIEEKVTIVSYSHQHRNAREHAISWFGPRVPIPRFPLLSPEEREIALKSLRDRNLTTQVEVKDGEILTP